MGTFGPPPHATYLAAFEEFHTFGGGLREALEEAIQNRLNWGKKWIVHRSRCDDWGAAWVVESHYSQVELCPVAEGGHLRYCELSCCLRKVISGGRGFLEDESGTLAWCSWRTFGTLVGRLGTRPWDCPSWEFLVCGITSVSCSPSWSLAFFCLCISLECGMPAFH